MNYFTASIVLIGLAHATAESATTVCAKNNYSISYLDYINVEIVNGITVEKWLAT